MAIVTRDNESGKQLPVSDPGSIDARPTKDLFISMLIRDIPLSRAILDFVDNSVDGAIQTRKGKDFKGFWAMINANPDSFRISDNCGGIDVEIARNYAFRFGRPEGMKPTLHSIGQFGVGMKRALFKLGSKFKIESTTKSTSFVLEEDINEWKEKEEWEFHFEKSEKGLKDVPVKNIGTTVTVTDLHETVKTSFGQTTFINSLGSQITEAHHNAMEHGLAISLNGIALEVQPLLLMSSNRIKTAKLERSLSQKGSVKATIFAGISESQPRDAGWYVYCNGRMVLGHDQTNTTGWGEGAGQTIPKYHNQFAMFRGFAFFESDDAGLLPWNTTKTGVDTDSPIFQSVRLSMVTLTRPVIDFLNRLDSEKNANDKPLTEFVEMAKLVPLLKVKTSDTFTAPSTARPAAPEVFLIQYSKPQSQIDAAKKVLKVRTPKEVGERTFDYFYERECRE